MSTNLMTASKSPLCLKRPVENITSNVEHCRLLVLTRKIVVDDGMHTVWPVIKPEARCVGFEYPGVFPGSSMSYTDGPSTLVE